MNTMQETVLQADDERLISDPPLLPREPYTWVITNGLNNKEEVSFYSISEDRFYIRHVPELHNMEVICCYGGWLVLEDKRSHDCSILNILTMEKFQLPKIPYYDTYHPCVLSSPIMDPACRIIFFHTCEETLKFSSCNLGDTEFIERDYDHSITRPINFNGKIYALATSNGLHDLVRCDFSDPNLHPEQVVSGESIAHYTIFLSSFLVESCGELLLILEISNREKVYDFIFFRADFNLREWVKLETLGDRVVFLNFYNSISSPASACGLKGNVVYWADPRQHLYMYDVEDQSITTKLPFPISDSKSKLYWVSFPETCSNEEKPQSTCRNPVFEALPMQTKLHLQCHTQSTKMQAERKEETGIIGRGTIAKRNSLWADLHNDFLSNIVSRLFAGDRVAFGSVCKSWYLVSSSATTGQLVAPNKSQDSSPFLVCSGYKLQNPIYGELLSTCFQYIPEGNIRAARYGWLLMQEKYSNKLFFYNQSTKEKKLLPVCDEVSRFHSLCFTAPPTSAGCLVVGSISTWGSINHIYSFKWGDDDWTRSDRVYKKNVTFLPFSDSVVVYKDLYYFLLKEAELLIYDPRKQKVSFKEAPKPIARIMVRGSQYLLESDKGKLMAVFVSKDGSSVYTCQWSVSKMAWQILESIGNLMLFISGPSSFCQRATVSGTGNKIYFPRVVGDDKILFYSLATKKYHTFDMGSSYRNFFGSKIYPKYDGCWFMS